MFLVTIFEICALLHNWRAAVKSSAQNNLILNIGTDWDVQTALRIKELFLISRLQTDEKWSAAIHRKIRYELKRANAADKNN